MDKYDKDSKEDFADPIVRCDSCNTILRRETISKIGCCSSCGNRRVKNVLTLKPEEMNQCKEWGIDPEFLRLFEEVNEEAING